MKYFILILSVAFISAITSCEGNSENESSGNIDSSYCECHELVFDEPYNHFYRFDRTEGYMGKCEEFYANEQLKMEKNFVDGKVNGTLKKYWENGQLAEVKEFDMNFQIGTQLNYNSEGDTVYHATYKRGRLEEMLLITPDYPTVE